MAWEARVTRARAPYALARAVAAALVVLAAAASAHTWAGGTLPTGPGLALIAAVLVAGGYLLFSREVPLWAVLPAVSVAPARPARELRPGRRAHPPHGGARPGLDVADGRWPTSAVTALTALMWWAGARLAAVVVLLLEHPPRPSSPGRRAR